MDKSLKVLDVKESGLKDRDAIVKVRKSDEQLLDSASQIKNLDEKISFLSEELKDFPTGLVKSKLLLSNLIKDTNLKFACELLISASYYTPLDPEIYLKYAELSLKNNAFKVSQSAIDIAKWVSNDEKNITEISSLESKIKEQQAVGKDNSSDAFWSNKFVSKLGVLERLYFQSSPKTLEKYSFKLIDSFPADSESYYIAFTMLSFIEKERLYKKYISYVEKYLANDKKNKLTFLGLAYFGLSDFDKSNEYLSEVIKEDPLNSRCSLFLSINNLLKGNVKDFVLYSIRIIPTTEPLFMAVYFINCAFSNFSVDKTEFPNQKSISKSIARIIELLIKNNQMESVKHLLDQFKKLELFTVLPSLPFFLCESLILSEKIDLAKGAIEGINDVEVHRLKAWIFRAEGDNSKADEELYLFRKSTVPINNSFTSKLVSLDFPDELPDDRNKLIDILKNLYEQTKKLIHKIDLEYGTSSMTCMEYACSECCTKTFPYVSYYEYLFMRQWLDEQNEDYKKQTLKYAQDIVNSFKKSYGRAPIFVAGEKNVREYYPDDFHFSCPYLFEGKCNIYEPRPFTCRAYGYGSQDGVKYKGCNYFFEQFKFATNLHDERKVINMQSFFDFAQEVDEKLLGKKILAPIPIWFAQSHDETMKMVNEAIKNA